jgi:hypothetical protein
MKTIEQIIDYLNKSNQSNYIELNYNDEWSFLDSKNIKEFIKEIKKKQNKTFIIFDYDKKPWYCEKIETNTGCISLKLKEVSNNYFIDEFDKFNNDFNC